MKVLTINSPKFGRFVLLAGSYHDYVPGAFGVKLAPEIDKPAHFEFGVKDFGAWTVDQFEAGLEVILTAMQDGDVPYIGCMMGQGRTGTVVAGLARVLLDLDADAAIAWTRNLYNAHAVETKQQRQLLADFSPADVARRANLQRAAVKVEVYEGGSGGPAADRKAQRVGMFRRLYDNFVKALNA